MLLMTLYIKLFLFGLNISSDDTYVSSDLQYCISHSKAIFYQKFMDFEGLIKTHDIWWHFSEILSQTRIVMLLFYQYQIHTIIFEDFEKGIIMTPCSSHIVLKKPSPIWVK